MACFYAFVNTERLNTRHTNTLEYELQKYTDAMMVKVMNLFCCVFASIVTRFLVVAVAALPSLFGETCSYVLIAHHTLLHYCIRSVCLRMRASCYIFYSFAGRCRHLLSPGYLNGWMNGWLLLRFAYICGKSCRSRHSSFANICNVLHLPLKCNGIEPNIDMGLRSVLCSIAIFMKPYDSKEN